MIVRRSHSLAIFTAFAAFISIVFDREGLADIRSLQFQVQITRQIPSQKGDEMTVLTEPMSGIGIKVSRKRQEVKKQEFRCDDTSDEKGVVNCVVNCSDTDPLTATYSIIFDLKKTYQTPPAGMVRVKKCRSQPDPPLTVVYRHWRLVLQEGLAELKNLEDNEGRSLMVPSATTGGSPSKLTSLTFRRPLKEVAGDPKNTKVIIRFRQLAANIAWASHQLNDEAAANQFSDYTVVAVNSMLKRIAEVYKGSEATYITVSGSLNDYYRNLDQVKITILEKGTAAPAAFLPKGTVVTAVKKLKKEPLNLRQMRKIDMTFSHTIFAGQAVQ